MQGIQVDVMLCLCDVFRALNSSLVCCIQPLFGSRAKALFDYNHSVYNNLRIVVTLFAAGMQFSMFFIDTERFCILNSLTFTVERHRCLSECRITLC